MPRFKGVGLFVDLQSVHWVLMERTASVNVSVIMNVSVIESPAVVA